MSATPYMQLYVGDYLSDTLHLTTEQHGAYLLLLMTMWRAGAELPNDPGKLARIARVSPKRWPAIWAEISEFFTVDGDVIRNDRLTKEHQKAVSISQERKTAGKKGGEANALKNHNAAEANASDLPKHSQKSESYKKEDTDVSLSSEADAKPRASAEISEAFSAYNDTAGRSGWPEAKVLTPERRRALSGRLREVGGIGGWLAAMKRAEDSDFLCGRTSKPFGGFSFDWVTKKANFTKLMEGNYDNRQQPDRASRQSPADDPTLRAIAIAAGMH